MSISKNADLILKGVRNMKRTLRLLLMLWLIITWLIPPIVILEAITGSKVMFYTAIVLFISLMIVSYTMYFIIKKTPEDNKSNEEDEEDY